MDRSHFEKWQWWDFIISLFISTLSTFLPSLYIWKHNRRQLDHTYAYKPCVHTPTKHTLYILHTPVELNNYTVGYWHQFLWSITSLNHTVLKLKLPNWSWYSLRVKLTRSSYCICNCPICICLWYEVHLVCVLFPEGPGSEMMWGVARNLITSIQQDLDGDSGDGAPAKPLLRAATDFNPPPRGAAVINRQTDTN